MQNFITSLKKYFDALMEDPAFRFSLFVSIIGPIVAFLLGEGFDIKGSFFLACILLALSIVSQVIGYAFARGVTERMMQERTSLIQIATSVAVAKELGRTIAHDIDVSVTTKPAKEA